MSTILQTIGGGPPSLTAVFELMTEIDTGSRVEEEIDGKISIVQYL